MPPVKEQKAQILNRLFAHKDTSPFILVTDSLAQSALPIVAEFLGKAHPAITVVEWKNGPPPKIDPNQRTFLIIHNLSTIPDIGRVLQSLMAPQTCILGIYHRDLEPDPGYAPRGLALVEYMATTIIHVEPTEETKLSIVEDPMLKFTVMDAEKIPVELTHRRRSGNATHARYIVDTKQHTAELQARVHRDDEDPSLLAGLTTFNLNTTDKQRADRENVDLPYLAAQEIGDGGAAGGAIIYQFEKDDDYDEEDPYEDPI